MTPEEKERELLQRTENLNQGIPLHRGEDPTHKRIHARNQKPKKSPKRVLRRHAPEDHASGMTTSDKVK